MAARKKKPAKKSARSAKKPAKSSAKGQKKPSWKDTRKPLPPLKKGEVRMLSGGNPQIAKGDGEGPVKAYIAALPGWKSGVAKRIDELITRAVPQVKKAVKWNSPMWGSEGLGYFASLHAFNKYLKVAFMNGAKLKPVPPEESKDPKVRYFHIYEGDKLDEKLLSSWFKQSSAIEGWMLKT